MPAKARVAHQLIDAAVEVDWLGAYDLSDREFPLGSDRSNSRARSERRLESPLPAHDKVRLAPRRRRRCRIHCVHARLGAALSRTTAAHTISCRLYRSGASIDPSPRRPITSTRPHDKRDIASRITIDLMILTGNGCVRSWSLMGFPMFPDDAVPSAGFRADGKDRRRRLRGLETESAGMGPRFWKRYAGNGCVRSCSLTMPASPAKKAAAMSRVSMCGF